MKKPLLLIYSTLLIPFIHPSGTTISAQIPEGYYSAAIGKKSQSLKTALSSIIYRSSNAGYDGLYTIYKTSDIREDGKVWDMYSSITNFSFSETCGNYKNEGDCFNREHSVPQSWFGSKSPMQSDAWHVVPSDGKINGMRSNHPLAEIANPSGTSAGGFSKWGKSTTPGFTGTAFEPNDQYKGDFARMYFYMATCYESKVGSWSGGIFSSSYPHLVPWTLNLMLKWHRQDPVSKKELDRNNAIYESVQKNRNPFVDYPELVELIFGNRQNEVFDPENSGPVEPGDPDFGLLDPSDITSESFTINWNPLKEATDYEVYVYTKTYSSSAPQTVFDFSMNSLPSGWSTGGFTEFNSGKVRLGSGSNYGEITTSSADLSRDNMLIIKHQPYGTDKSPLLVYINDRLIKTLNYTNSDVQTDTIFIKDESETSKIKLRAEKNARQYVMQVTLKSGSAPVMSAVEGYPLMVGNVITHTVSGLNELTDYYYRLTPYINETPAQPTSDKQITTSVSDALSPTFEEDQVITFINDGRLHILNAPRHAGIIVYDVTGKKLISIRAIQEEEIIELPERGIYLLNITHESVRISRKIAE